MKLIFEKHKPRLCLNSDWVGALGWIHWSINKCWISWAVKYNKHCFHLITQLIYMLIPTQGSDFQSCLNNNIRDFICFDVSCAGISHADKKTCSMTKKAKETFMKNYTIFVNFPRKSTFWKKISQTYEVYVIQRQTVDVTGYEQLRWFPSWNQNWAYWF